MSFVVDNENLGTPAEAWATSRRVATLRPLDALRPARAIIVAPHPDDEVLGTAGLLQDLHLRGVEIVIVAVTDGEASHPESVLAAKLDLRSIRAKESRIALRRLGIAHPSIVRLRIPDGSVTKNVERLEAELERLLRPTDLCLTPWNRDGHPDHDACGTATLNVAGMVGNDVLHYLVWALHWADPESDHLPWAAVRRFELSASQCARKRRATLAFGSQIRRLGRSPEETPVLPMAVLRRHWLDCELLIDPIATEPSPTALNLGTRKESA